MKGNDEKVRKVWIVRHGERIDEVDRTWTRRNLKIAHDPPLTSVGKVQAMKAANFLRSLEGKVKFERVHVSPLVRALQTAERISDAMDLPVRVNNGLGYFAAQTALYELRNSTKPPFVQDVAKCCPLMKLDKDHDRKHRHPMDTLCDIVENTKDGHDTLIVAHRECIRDLMNPEMAAKTRLPYCSVALFTYKNRKSWKLVRIFKQVV